MHLIFTLARLFPYWGLAVVLLSGQLGVFFRRKGSVLQWYCWANAGFYGFMILLWLVFRGDMNSDAWIKGFFGG